MELWVKKARELYEMRLARKQLEKREAEVMIELRTLSKEESYMAGGFSLTRSERKGVIDYGIIPELRGINLEQYRKETVTVWKLDLIYQGN